MGHDVLQEQIVDAIAGRAEVLELQRRPDVVHHRQRRGCIEHLFDQRRGFVVAGEDHRQLILPAEPRLRLRRGDEFGHLHDVPGRAAVGAAGEQHHVGPKFADALNFLVRLASIVRGEDVHDDRPGAEGGPLGARRGHPRTTPATIICSPPPALDVEI